MRILVAADKFKGSLTQQEVCDAIASGIRQVYPDAQIDLCPLADGGEGTVEAIVAATGGWVDTVDVCGPLPGMRVAAPVGFIDEGKTAIVELATASGLLLLEPHQRNPVRTTTYGTGELLRYAAEHGAKKIILGIGGSATTDAGVGIAQAWGGAVKMVNGKVYSPNDRRLCGQDLGQILAITRYDPEVVEYPYHARSARARQSPILDTRGVEFVVACDVGNPLYGPDGAAVVFAPQKGASEAEVEQLDADLKKMVDRLELHDVANAPGAGAAGGAGFGMMAFFGARMVSGAELIIDLTHLKQRIDDADLVITGEGKLDAQTLSGKAPLAVAEACKAAGKRCIAIGGALAPGVEKLLDHGVTSYFSIAPGPVTLSKALELAEEFLTDTTSRIMRLL